ncbi:hypothetical protein NQ317_005746 [Molorchus minor]|uniref:Uncharacterized protein n=1 Tax=Molorchus minor TaxID=1323400 RepID=A0ABQ9JLZ1_9CUCU|nr:hypothetical protein NQ317_005746 [Molorchus minor]
MRAARIKFLFLRALIIDRYLYRRFFLWKGETMKINPTLL